MSNKLENVKQKNEFTATKSKTDLEQWEDEQLNIFSDIIIAILFTNRIFYT